MFQECPVPNCKRKHPSNGHLQAHRRKGELVTVKEFSKVLKQWILVWALPKATDTAPEKEPEKDIAA